jgi:hypothetical protein
MDCLRCFNKESDENNEESNKESNKKSNEERNEESNEEINKKIDEKIDEKSDDKIDVDTSSILDDIVVIETDKSELNSPIIFNETYCK